MNPNNNPNQTSPQVLIMLWGAMLMSMCLLLFVAWNFGQEKVIHFEHMVPNFQDPFQVSLCAISGFLLFASQIIPNRITARLKKNLASPIETQRLFQIATTPLIIGSALREAIVLFGFAIATVTSDFNKALPFFIVGVVAHLSQFPSESKLRELFKTDF